MRHHEIYGSSERIEWVWELLVRMLCEVLVKQGILFGSPGR